MEVTFLHTFSMQMHTQKDSSHFDLCAIKGIKNTLSYNKTTSNALTNTVAKDLSNHDQVCFKSIACLKGNHEKRKKISKGQYPAGVMNDS